VGANAWIAGVMGLYLGVGAIVALLARTDRRVLPDTMWDVPNTGRTYTTVIGSLAAFAGTSAVFVARLGVDRPGPEFEVVFALFVFAFPTLLASAIQHANVPSLASSPDPYYLELQRYAWFLATTTLVQGLVLEWSALFPLARLVGATELAEVLRWWLLAILVPAVLWLAQFLEEFTPLPRRAALAIPAAGVSGAVLYYALSGQQPALWPGDLAPMRIAATGFFLALGNFGLQMAMTSIYSPGRPEGRARALLPRLAAAQGGVAATSAALLAISVLTA
jgi:hypothetical protein